MSENSRLLNGPEEPKVQTWEGGCLWTGIGVIFGGLALGLLFVIISLTRISRIEQVPETVITVIAPATSTALIHSTIPEGSEIEDDTTATDDLGVSEVFSEGDLVEVYGTEDQGLSLRNTPGLSSVVGGYGLESEVFEVQSGPIDIDGYTWWYLVNPYDNTKQGWGVARFLRKISP